MATADLFPRFTLGGLIGTQAFDAGALFERDSEMRLLTLGVDGSFLNVGRVRARIAASEAGAQVGSGQGIDAPVVKTVDAQAPGEQHSLADLEWIAANQ